MSEESVIIKFGGDTGAVAKALRGIGSMASEIFHSFVIPLNPGAVIEGLKEISNEVKQMVRVSTESGLGVEEWQKLAYTYEVVGGTAQQAERSLGKLAALIGEADAGVQSAVDTFLKWNVSIHNTDGSLRTSGQVYDEVANNIDRYATASEKAAMMQDLLGDKSRTALTAMQEWTKTHGQGVDFVTEAEVKKIEDATRKLEAFEQKIKVTGIKAAAWFLEGNEQPTPNAAFGGPLAGTQSAAAFYKKRLEFKARSGELENFPKPPADQHARDIEFEHQYNEAIQKAAQSQAKHYADSLRGETQLAFLRLRHAHIEDEIVDLQSKENKTLEEKKQLLADISEKSENETKQLDAQTKLHEKELEYQKEYKNLQIEIGTAQRNLAEYRQKATDPTIKELAQQAGAPRRRQGGIFNDLYGDPNAYGMAYNIEQANRDIHSLKFRYGHGVKGNEAATAREDMLEGMVEGWTKKLSDEGYTSPEHTLEEMKTHLAALQKSSADLLAKAGGDGINIAHIINAE